MVTPCVRSSFLRMESLISKRELVIKEGLSYNNEVTIGISPVNQSDELKLVERAKTDTEAFSELYDLYFSRVYNFVAAKIGRQEDTEDLVSDIFMKILEKLDKFKDRGVPFGAWVFKICRNEIYDYYKKTGRDKTTDLDNAAEIKDKDETPDKKAHQVELSEQVRKVLSELPERDQSVVELKFYSGLNNREIADALGLTESNIGVILFRVLKRIKPELKTYA